MLGYEVRRLQTVPGIGPIVASVLVAVSSDAGSILPPGWGWCPGNTVAVDMKGPAASPNARSLRTHHVGARRPVGVSSAGRDPDNMDSLYCKARRIAGRRGRNKAVVAVTNQMTRISWVILAKGAEYDSLRTSQGGSTE